MSDMKYVPFYVDWYEMMQTKDTAEKKVAFIEAIFEYALNESVPPSPREIESPRGVDYARRDGYLLARSTLDFILPKIQAGSKGGVAGRGERKARFGNKNASKTQAENASKTQATHASETQAENASKTQAPNATLNKDKDKDKYKDNNLLPPLPPKGVDEEENRGFKSVRDKGSDEFKHVSREDVSVIFRRMRNNGAKFAGEEYEEEFWQYLVSADFKKGDGMPIDKHNVHSTVSVWIGRIAKEKRKESDEAKKAEEDRKKAEFYEERWQKMLREPTFEED